MNALGIGPAVAGATIIQLNNGALYYSPYTLTVSGAGAQKVIVTAHVGSNFTHGTALVVESCPSNLSCDSAGQYSAMSTNAGAETTVVPAPGIGNQSVIAGIAIFIPDNNGGSAFSGGDAARIILTLRAANDNSALATAELRLDAPDQKVQSALRLNLATAPGGLTVAPAADFSMSFGNVNGLGIGPAAGLTTVGAAGGIIYSTPYLLQPAFSDFTSTTASINVYVSSDFAHPASLQLDDGGASGGPYNAISKIAGTPTVITTTAANRSSITRYLGLFVSNISGPTAYAGSDNAQLTFTLTVP
ncbi:MAG TPA: hypothetical protein VEW69_11495 [Alphaproteobacteria bacterium]|nr:hypothetical protein [Alphaproteobacteria bacterium]